MLAGVQVVWRKPLPALCAQALPIDLALLALVPFSWLLGLFGAGLEFWLSFFICAQAVRHFVKAQSLALLRALFALC